AALPVRGHDAVRNAQRAHTRDSQAAESRPQTVLQPEPAHPGVEHPVAAERGDGPARSGTRAAADRVERPALRDSPAPGDGGLARKPRDPGPQSPGRVAWREGGL